MTCKNACPGTSTTVPGTCNPDVSKGTVQVECSLSPGQWSAALGLEPPLTLMWTGTAGHRDCDCRADHCRASPCQGQGLGSWWHFKLDRVTVPSGTVGQPHCSQACRTMTVQVTRQDNDCHDSVANLKVMVTIMMTTVQCHGIQVDSDFRVQVSFRPW